MKRILSLALAVVVLVASLAVPAYAAESSWYDVLSYTTPNDSGSYMVSAGNNELIHFDYPFSEVGFVDFVVQFRTGTNASAFINVNGTSIQLSSVKIDYHTYRFYGSVYQFSNSGFDIFFTGISYGEIQFHSFRSTSLFIYSNDCPITGFVSYAGGEEVPFYYNNWDDYQGAILNGSSNLDYEDYNSYIDIPSWRLYDFIDLQIYGIQLSINSISASIGDYSVPLEISYINAENALSDFLVNISLDLRNVNRSDEDLLTIVVTGDVPPIDGRLGRFTVMYSSGFVGASNVNQSLSFWYRFKSFLSNCFNSLGSWFTVQTNTLSDRIGSMFDNLDSWLTVQTNTLSDRIGSMFDNLHSWLTVQTNTLSDRIGSLFDNLHSWVDSQTTSIGLYIDYYINKVETWIETQTSSLVTNLEYYLNKVNTSINSWGQKIVDVLTPDSASADSVVDKTQQQADQMDDNNNALQQLQRPDLNAGVSSGDISGIVSPSNTIKYTLFLTRIMHAPILSEVIMLSMIFSLAAYVLFGKR